MSIKDYFRRAWLYVVSAALFIGGNIVALAFHAAVNALGTWIILEQFDKSLSFWQYILIGAGLTVILNGNKADSD